MKYFIGSTFLIFIALTAFSQADKNIIIQKLINNGSEWKFDHQDRVYNIPWDQTLKFETTAYGTLYVKQTDSYNYNDYTVTKPVEIYFENTYDIIIAIGEKIYYLVFDFEKQPKQIILRVKGTKTDEPTIDNYYNETTNKKKEF